MQELSSNQALVISLSPTLDYYLVGLAPREFFAIGSAAGSKETVSLALDTLDLPTLTKVDANGLPRTMMRSAVGVVGSVGKWFAGLGGHPPLHVIREVARTPDLASAIVAAKAAIG